MSHSYPNALPLARKVLRALIVLNLVMGAAILALLIASLVARSWVMTALGVPPTADNGTLFIGMRGIMVIGIASAPLTHIVLSRLLAIVGTVRDGDPFVAENAARLQHIAWSVLGLELLHVVVMWIAATVATETVDLDLKWRLNVARWVTVLLLFVLARVFEHGTRMRTDLEGTV